MQDPLCVGKSIRIQRLRRSQCEQVMFQSQSQTNQWHGEEETLELRQTKTLSSKKRQTKILSSKKRQTKTHSSKKKQTKTHS